MAKYKMIENAKIVTADNILYFSRKLSFFFVYFMDPLSILGSRACICIDRVDNQ